MTLSNNDVANLCEIADVVAQYNCFPARYDAVKAEFSQGIVFYVNGCRCAFQYYFSDNALEFAKKVCELAKDRGTNIRKIDKIIASMLMQLETEKLIELDQENLNEIIRVMHERLMKQVPKLKVPEGNYEKDDF